METVFNGRTYKEVWVKRFNFFKQYGAPSSQEAKAAFKALSFGDKLKINMNFLAFFFSFIYYFVKGMWKAGLTIFAIVAVGAVVANFLPKGIDNGLMIALALLSGITANYTYYRKEVLCEDDFNIFKGMRW